MKQTLLLNHRLPLILMFLVTVVILPAALAQNGVKSRESLEKSKKDLENEIAYKRDLLFQTQRSRKASLSEVSLLSDLISKREALISTIDSEIDYLDRQIETNRKHIERLERDLVRLKDEYRKLVYFAYRNKSSYQRLMFIFAADDFNQAYQRLRYMQEYSRYRKRQARNIRLSQESMAVENEQMEGQRNEKKSLMGVQEGERSKLAREKDVKDKTVKQLSQREGALKSEIADKQAAARKLQKEIDDIIARAIEASKARNTTAPVDDKSFALSPEEQLLSKTFSDNRGRLPWPTERGHKSLGFGTQPHPDLKGIVIQNNGVDILTSSGSSARAVFAGTVTAVRSVPKYRTVVIIRHGDFLTVYTNLDQVVVKEGDNVETRQVLGTIHTNPETSRTEIHFEIRKGTTTLNPEDWLAGSL